MQLTAAFAHCLLLGNNVLDEKAWQNIEMEGKTKISDVVMSSLDGDDYSGSRNSHRKDEAW